MDFGAPAEPAAQEPAAQGEAEDWLSGLDFAAETPAPAEQVPAEAPAAEIDFGAMDFGAPAEPRLKRWQLKNRQPMARKMTGFPGWTSRLKYPPRRNKFRRNKLRRCPKQPRPATTWTGWPGST
jgi:hypothetical protein